MLQMSLVTVFFGMSFLFLVHCSPLPVRWVDLTHEFDNNTLFWAGHKKIELHVTRNENNGGPDSPYWYQIEELSSGSHVGTHMDAPCHTAFGAWTLDEIPLNRFIAPAAVIDIVEQSKQNVDYEVTIEDLIGWEDETGQSLDETIVLMRSGWSKRWGDREAFTGTAELDVTGLHNPGLSREAAQWLVENRNIYGIGTEAVSFDIGKSTEYHSHRILLPQNVYGLENVGDLDELPLCGATLHVFPMKVGSGSGAPVRILASIPQLNFRYDTHSLSRRSLVNLGV